MLQEIQKFLSLIKNHSIVEAKLRLDHPEDLVILDGTSGANKAIQAAISTAKNPKATTIKWDGYPALIFGHGPDGKFSIMDKHMFDKTDGSGRKIYSPKQFIQYDNARGINRAELHDFITNTWNSLKKASQGTKGYYWGDLLFSQPLQEKDGLYKFKANPKGITYTVDANSDIGKLLADKIAGIAVHQYLPPYAGSTSTYDATSLNGTIGNLKNNSDVAIIPSAMPIVPNIKIDNTLLQDAKSAISKYGPAVENLLGKAPQARSTYNSLFTTYINKKIVSGNLSNLADDFMEYFESRPMTVSMKKKLSDHLNTNKEGIIGLFTIWVALYKLKMNVVDQLSKAAEQGPVKGYLENGQQSQEGFVSQGVKFIDRLGFSRQNLAAKR